MARIVLIYGTTSGNTEDLSESVADGLKSCGAEVIVKNATDANVNELKDYDAIVLGCPTYGNGELQDDFIDFNSALSSISLEGKKAAVFGPGDSGLYPDTFCQAVEILEDTLKKCGAKIVVDAFKVDGDVIEAIVDAEGWGSEVAGAI